MKFSSKQTHILKHVYRAEEDMKKNHTQQKLENQKIQSAITVLKTEKTNLHQHLLDLKRRVAELELQIGDENNWKGGVPLYQLTTDSSFWM